jgi:hypothetical protein
MTNGDQPITTGPIKTHAMSLVKETYREEFINH